MSFIANLGDWLRKITRSFTSASISGRNITLTRHNGDTVVLTTQDTTYDLSVYALKNGVFTNNDLTRTSPTGKTAIAFRNGTTGGTANKAEIVDFGWDVTNRDGAVLGLRSVSHSTQSGYFQLNARDATNESILQGTPSGDLTWKNNKVITIVDEASPSLAGVMSASDKSKLDGITAGAEPNQNAFSTVKVDSTNVSAGTKTDTLTLVSGNAITLTPDTANDKITIAVTSNTFYPITGGTIQGNSIEFTGSSPYIGPNTTDKYLRLFNTDFTGGGSLYLYGKDFSGGEAGAFRLNAHDGTNYHSLIGYPGGRLIWDGVDVIYTHPTTSGNKHIPSGGSSGQILRWSADGTAVWGADQDTTYGLATQSADGLMSATDKIQVDKLNGNINLANTAPYVSSGDTSKYLRLYNTDFTGGASVYLYGKDYPDTDAGAFQITAHDGTNYNRLIGRTNGTLVWDGHNVLTDAVSYAKVADLPSLYTSINFSSTSVPNATFTNLGSFTPSKTGKWLVIINVSIDSNANGYRRLIIANNATGNYPDRFRYVQTDGTTANSTLLQLSWLWNCTSISTVYFNVYQTSGVALNASGGYRAYYLGG